MFASSFIDILNVWLLVVYFFLLSISFSFFPLSWFLSADCWAYVLCFWNFIPFLPFPLLLLARIFLVINIYFNLYLHFSCFIFYLGFSIIFSDWNFLAPQVVWSLWHRSFFYIVNQDCCFIFISRIIFLYSFSTPPNICPSWLPLAYIFPFFFSMKWYVLSIQPTLSVIS